MNSFLSLKKKVWAGYVIAFILLLTAYVVIFYTMRRSIRETNVVTHTYSVMNKLEMLKGEMTDAETGVRGYLLTKDERFLSPYYSSVNFIPGILSDLGMMMNDNPEQLNRLDSLSYFINIKLGLLSTNLKTFRANGMLVSDSMRAHREASKESMDKVRHYCASMKTVEETLNTDRKEKLSGFFDSMQIIAIISLLIAFITLTYSLIIFNKENKAKEIAIRKAMKYSAELEENISELKNTNIELEEFKSVEKFTATGRISRTIAHEVRNPLTNITLAAEQLHENIPNSPDTTVLLDMITRNANRINQLVSELLNATRFAHLEFQKADATRLLEETLELAKDRIELNHIQVVKNYSEEPCKVSVDIEKIKLALLNIIVNAIEAMEKNKGVLTLKTKTQGNKCFIEIRDNGKGMEDDVLQNLFEPYFTGKLKGNGLGLTNTQNIILNHKGTIKVYSKPEHGATFIIILNASEA